MSKQLKTKPKNPHRSLRQRLFKWFTISWFHRALLVIMTVVFVFTSVSYGIAYWYQQKHKNDRLVVGTTFVANYARYFGLDPQQTLDAMINEVGFRQFRLVSYWDEIEKTPGTYDFTDLDWQFKAMEQSNSKVSLAIGLRQPRWPECHMPDWAKKQSMKDWEPKLKSFMKVVMERYKDSPVLESYQLENEFFLDVFGECPDFSRDRLIREYDFAKNIDSTHPIIVSRSNNAIGYPLGNPRPDEFGVSVYKRVWDKSITKRYFEYPFPAWFYGTLAGGGEILTGKNLVIHELQMEAWLPDNGKYAMNDLNSINEQNKSMNAKRLKDRFEYGEDSGIKTIYTWGSEWWYWRKIKAGDPSLWNVATQEVHKANSQQP